MILDGLYTPGAAHRFLCLPKRMAIGLGLAASLALPSFPVSSATSEDKEMESELHFLAAERDTIMTASRTEERTDKSIATSTVITQDDIKRMGARTLSDALQIVPGIGISQTEYGIAAIDVRGVKTSDSSKILILLNGHPLDQDMANPGSTWVYDDLAVDTIKRIEVVRGSSSALYGANAMMAVINIITQTAKDTHGVQTSAGYGTYNTQQYRASAGKQFDNGEAVVHFNYRTTNGYGDNPQGAAPANKYDLEWQLGYEGFKLDGRFIDKNINPFISPFNTVATTQSGQYDNYFVRLSRDWNPLEDLKLNTQVYYDSFYSNSFGSTVIKNANGNPLPMVWSGNSNDSRTGGEIQANYRLSRNNSLIGGVTLARESYDPLYSDSINPTPVSNPLSRMRYGIYMQDMWEIFKNLHISLGGRYDKYSNFSGQFNPRLGFNWEFIRDYAVKFSYGRAYRAPNPGEQDATANFRVIGDPGLQPEKEQTFEGGIIAKPFTGFSTQAVYFHSKITNIIAPVSQAFCQDPCNQTYQNLGTLITQGLEWEGRYDFQSKFYGSYLLANYVHQNPMYQNPLLNGWQTAPNVPRNRVNLIANWSIDRHWNLFANLRYNGAIDRSILNEPDLGGYTLINLSLLNHAQIIKGLDIGLTVYNLLDKYYVDPTNSFIANDSTGSASAALNQALPNGFATPGRTFYGHISVRF